MFGCKKKAEIPEPTNLIDKATLTNMMTEQLEIESLIFFSPPDTNKRELSIHLYNDFLLRHHVTKEQYSASVSYYFSNKEQSNEILQQVSDNLIAKRQAILNE